jgi:hypothetical protein
LLSAAPLHAQPAPRGEIRAVENAARQALRALKNSDANLFERAVVTDARRDLRAGGLDRMRQKGHVENWDGTIKGVYVDGTSALALYCKPADNQLLLLSMKKEGNRWLAQDVVVYERR